MDPVQQLLDIEAIKQLKARYFRCMDTKDWQGLRAVFCDDASFDARTSLSVEPQGEDAPPGVHRGGDEVANFVREAVTPLVTVHHGHAHEIEILSSTEARGVIAMEDQIWDGATGAFFLHGCGHYHETYRREADGWRILTSRLTRLYVKVGEPAETPATP